MNPRPLPVILSRPHGGLTVPPEIATRLQIDATTLYNECDLWVDQLYDFAHPSIASEPGNQPVSDVLAVVDMPIARVFVDANRPPNDLHDPDGPIKTTTSYGESIYRTPLTPEAQGYLRATYWQPFHTALEQAWKQHAAKCKLLLDCHNMAQIGPSAYGDPGAARPLVCLANLGDANGEQLTADDPVSCPPGLLRQAGQLAKETFSGLILLDPSIPSPPIVRLNVPFRGGYIVRRLRDLAGPTVPMIMIEVNRGLFVGRQHSRTPIAPPNKAIIQDLRQRLFQWTKALLALL